MHIVDKDATCYNIDQILHTLNYLFYSLSIQGVVSIIQPLLDIEEKYSSVALGDGELKCHKASC